MWLLVKNCLSGVSDHSCLFSAMDGDFQGGGVCTCSCHSGEEEASLDEGVDENGACMDMEGQVQRQLEQEEHDTVFVRADHTQQFHQQQRQQHHHHHQQQQQAIKRLLVAVESGENEEQPGRILERMPLVSCIGCAL